MKKLVLLSTLLMFCLSVSYAQVESDFERFKREQEASLNSMKQNEKLSLEKMEKEYQDYLKAEQEAYDKFVKEMSAVWGGKNVVESTSKEWVEYTDNGNSRSIVDFEKGEVTIEIIVTDEESASEEKMEKKV